MLSDLEVIPSSQCLKGQLLDLVVTGSIAAVESLRFIRSLRRRGADLQVWASEGAERFIGLDALAWASGKAVRRHFAGEHSHLALGDACIVAPCSASFLGRLTAGISDSPASALVASYFGQGRPVVFLPAMHESLAHNPIFVTKLYELAQHAKELPSRIEEGKVKFPDPDDLADHVSHHLNRVRFGGHRVIVTLGGTIAALDAVRFIANRSTGALGSRICEEAYRYGLNVISIEGFCQIRPRVVCQRFQAPTYVEMRDTLLSQLHDAPPQRALVMSAAILDFDADQPRVGKTPSKQQTWEIHLKPTAKILAEAKGEFFAKVAFKLLSRQDQINMDSLVEDYRKRYLLSMLATNFVEDIGPQNHQASLFEWTGAGTSPRNQACNDKEAIAAAIVQHLVQRAPQGD